jgi:hypothetical membrane protein
MYFEGLIIGFLSLAVIGIFHPIVIKCEYYFSDKIWPLFLLMGLGAVLLSCLVSQRILSAFLAIWGCTCFWSILELKKQTKRVEKGWFPANPKRTPDGG